MHQFDVSVVVPTYNRLTMLKRTIQCLVNQTYDRKRYEIIIVDDCSVDGTRDYLKATRVPVPLQIVYNEANMRRAKTRNAGLHIARGEYILMIDDDIWAEPDLINAHYSVHKNIKEMIGVIGAIHVSNRVPKTAINSFLCDKHHWCYTEMVKKQDDLPFTFFKTANVSLPRKLISTVGYFNESFITYGGEDTDLGARLHALGIKLLFAPNAKGYHYHDETVESFVSKETELAKSLLLYNKIHQNEIFNSHKSFFIPIFNKPITIKTLLYNTIKYILFNKLGRNYNKLFVRLVNNSSNNSFILKKYFIPLLKIQYQNYGIKTYVNK